MSRFSMWHLWGFQELSSLCTYPESSGMKSSSPHSCKNFNEALKSEENIFISPLPSQTELSLHVCLFERFPSFQWAGQKKSHMTTVTSGSGFKDDYSAALGELILQAWLHGSLSLHTVQTCADRPAGTHTHTNWGTDWQSCQMAESPCHLNHNERTADNVRVCVSTGERGGSVEQKN